MDESIRQGGQEGAHGTGMQADKFIGALVFGEKHNFWKPGNWFSKNLIFAFPVAHLQEYSKMLNLVWGTIDVLII